MKKSFLTLMIVAASMMAACSQKSSDADFIVTGKIENVEDGYLILFFKSNLDASTTHIAVDTLKNGRFEFSAPAETGVQYHIVVPYLGIFPSMSVDFYTEPGEEVRIHGNDYLTKNWTVKTNVKDQKIYQSYFDEVADLYKELQLLELQCRKEGRMLEFFDRQKPCRAKIDSIELAWLKTQKQISEPWMDLMLLAVKGARHYNEKDNLKQLQELWKEVDDGYKTSIKGKNISSLLHPNGEPLNVGDKFPYEIEVSDLNGEIHSLAEFEGKAMLLYFSSYSCKPCVAAKKELDRMISSGNCPVEVVGFNMDTENVWQSKGKDNPVSWHDFNDLKGSYGFNTRFKTQGIPTFVIVSKEGKILDIWAGYRDGIIRERIDAVL